MKHYYQNIEGWFNFGKLYTRMVNKYPNKSHFVEVGSWLGKSTVYMAVEIINSNKDIRFDCVDSWREGFDIFIRNINPLAEVINYHRMPSVEAAMLYKDKSLDFVFLDAGHTYEDVMNDLISWYPKVKSGGAIAGHDYQGEGVKKAVDEFFINLKVRKIPPDEGIETSWINYKK
jgi:predicted O-methyltransferase YrrM